jgi:uncharacterized protein (TIGR04551 family)
MNSVFRLPTFLASLVAATLLAIPALSNAVPSGAVAQNDQGDQPSQQQEPNPETDDETTSTEDSSDSESSGQASADEPDQSAEDEQSSSADDTSSDEAGSEASTDTEPAPSGEMTPAGEGALDAPGTVEETGESTESEGADTATGNDSDSPPQQVGDSSSKDNQNGSPISDLADSQSSSDGFEPVEDIEEEMLQEITPTKVYPYFEWDGFFRLRSDAMVNLDLDTGGTSAILPPAETYKPSVNAANPGSELLWSTNMNLRFDPTLHISESLSVHVEADLLDNVVLGSLSDQRLNGYRGGTLPDPSRTVTSANQISPRESDAFQNAVRINEAYGQIDSFFGRLKAGRMDFDWGLGTYANGGDCVDCDYGDHVDRVKYLSRPIFNLRASAAIDFPSQGPTSAGADRVDGQPYDLGQIDDARQYTFSILKKPLTKKEKEQRQKHLKEDQKPAYDGGVLFSYRQQKGRFFDDQDNATSGSNGSLQDARLVYRGLDMFVPDVWFRMMYNPDSTTKIRVELESTGVFGQIDNTTDQQLSTSDTNCFNEDNQGIEECTTIDQQGGDTTSTDEGIAQIGGALESEFYFGGPVRFGLNAGYASGGSTPNYGYQAGNSGGDVDFYRMDPNYHVDLILFREVIGTVTNAYYANPYVQARFFETPDRRLELQFDGIVSRAANAEGTPAGDDNWLGVELDGAVRYLQTETFRAGLEGGVLFPLGGLSAVRDRPRLTRPGTTPENFTTGNSPSVAWTVQTNLTWLF